MKKQDRIDFVLAGLRGYEKLNDRSKARTSPAQWIALKLSCTDKQAAKYIAEAEAWQVAPGGPLWGTVQAVENMATTSEPTPAKPKRKTVLISVRLPVTCSVEVTETDDDLTITGVRRLDCDASARTISECMDDDDYDGLRAAFDKAPERE